ncbi:hypothetical protein CTEN210_09789 [Chaetoceros tenuissimus]|uniref:Uncharacterized protein n=1 Tax=Chaetoceros tenuissimus TaxID=426638 RepID=A0AAD3H7Y3_9STRA|nr:hypothetical protein CTEN210_09789 [Chaetoceros tenuissimus]
MRDEDSSSSSNGMLLEPSATMNDLPSEVMKNIFSFVGKGNYCFVAPVSKDFCYNYLTFDVIEDKFAHRLDYLQAIGRNKVTTAEAASTSFDLAEYFFLHAPDEFHKRVVKSAILRGKVDIVEVGHAMGIDVKELFLHKEDIVGDMLRRGDLEMFILLVDLGLLLDRNDAQELLRTISYVGMTGQLGILKWLHENGMCKDEHTDIIFGGATFGGNIQIVKWTESTFNCRCPKELARSAVCSGNVELVKYLENKTWDEYTILIAAKIGNIELLQYLLESGCSFNDRWIGPSAIENNNHEKVLEVLHWLHEHGVPLDEKTCTHSAGFGNLKALKYARSKKCPWDDICLEIAVQSHDLEVVEYCLTNGCAIGTNAICHLAMRDGDYDRALRMLKLLRKFSVPWSEETCSVAAGHGNFEALKWAVLMGCPWDRRQCAYYAAEDGDIEVLKWMKSQGCEWNERIGARAAEKGHLETLKYFRSDGCHFDKYTLTEAIWSRNFAIVEYCAEHNFPFDERIYEYVVDKFHDPIPIIKLFQKNGYPWHPSACKEAAHKGDLKLLRWLRYNGCMWDEETCNL